MCTTRRESYQALVTSLARQTEDNYELLTIPERGPLAALRNQGLRAAHAPVVCFIDDDTICPPTWLSGVLDAFRRPAVVGVSGPAIITDYWRRNRHLFRYPALLDLYGRLFLDGNCVPGHLCRSGAPTTVSADTTCTYEGPVDFLEACNMAYKTDALKGIGGFDEAYRALGEWSEPDCAYRLRAAAPGTYCYFTPAARLFHQPARGVATLRRRHTTTRYRNYSLFAARWVKPCWRHTAYRAFLRTYFAAVEGGLVSP